MKSKKEGSNNNEEDDEDEDEDEEGKVLEKVEHKLKEDKQLLNSSTRVLLIHEKTRSLHLHLHSHLQISFHFFY